MSVVSSSFVGIFTKIDQFTLWVGKFVGWMLIPMILSLAYEVVARYAFGKPTIWAYDMTFMLYGSFFMLGASYTLRKKGHIRTDMFYERWSPRKQAYVDLACYVLFFYPLVLVFTLTGWEYFLKAFLTNERFVYSRYMAITWPFKLVLPTTGFLLGIQGFSEVLKCIITIQTNHWPTVVAVEEKAST